jgi:hypothetical protein
MRKNMRGRDNQLFFLIRRCAAEGSSVPSNYAYPSLRTPSMSVVTALVSAKRLPIR